MSRIINIGDFYRAQISFPSVIGSIGSLEIHEGTEEFLLYTSFATGAISTGTAQSGTTGPISLIAKFIPPSVGQFARFDGITGSYAISATGMTGDNYYFTILPPLFTDMVSDLCQIYNSSGVNIQGLLVSTGMSGDSNVSLNPGVIRVNTGDYLLIPGSFGPSLITSASGTIESTVYINDILPQNYANYSFNLQTRIVLGTGSTGPSGSSGNFISNGNAHAKRQFGNHPRRQ